MKAKNEETIQLKRTHKKPYKVGKLYFGRKSTTRGAGWVVSASEDLSNPIKEFEVGKQARYFCEDARDGRVELPQASAEISINIPAGTGMTNIFEDISDNKIV